MSENQTTNAVDWRSILVRYANAVMDDDICVGDRCLTDPNWCPKWTDEERNALALIRQEAWPEGYEMSAPMVSTRSAENG